MWFFCEQKTAYAMRIIDWSSDVCSSDLLPKSRDFVSSILLDDYQYWKDDIKGTDNKDQVLGNLERYWRYNALDTRNTLFNTLLLIQLMKLSDRKSVV